MLNRLSRICDKFAWIMLCVLMADVCIFGAGKLVSVGPLSFRMLLLALTSLVCLPIIIKNFVPLIKSKYTWVVGGFALWLILSTVVGIRNGNNMSLLITDWKGFLYFILFPTAICLVNTKQRAQILTKVMMYSAGVMAVLHILCIFCYLWNPELLDSLNSYAFDVHFFYISYKISDVNVRINFLSLACQLFGCAFSVYYLLKEQKLWKQLIYGAITALCLFAIWLSYTRSIYLAAGVAAIGTVVVLLIRTDKTTRKQLFTRLFSSVLAFFVLIAAFRIGTGTNYFLYGLSRSLVGIEIGNTSISIPISPTSPDTNPTESMMDTDPTDSTMDTDPTDSIIDADSTESTIDTAPTESSPIDPGSTDAPSAELDTFHTSTISSDMLRSATINDLVSLIKSSPVWGHGLGATIPSRPDGLNEYFFLDLTAKTGLVGLFLYLAPVIFMLWSLIRKLKEHAEDFAFYGLWFVVVLGFVLYSYFTPCMNSSVGIMCYCCAMAVFQQSSATKNNI